MRIITWLRHHSFTVQCFLIGEALGTLTATFIWADARGNVSGLTTVVISQLFALAAAFMGDYLDAPIRKRKPLQ